jgi:hypothetical protein
MRTFIAAGFTPEEVSSYRSQINPQVTPFVPRPEDTLTQGPTSYRTTAPQGGYADIYRSSVLARKKEEPASVGFARDYMDFLPGIGDVIGAGEVAQELTSEDPNYPLATALGAATVIGAVPVVGDFVARAVAKTAQNVFDSPFGNKVLDYLRSVKTDAPGRPPLTFDEVEAAMKAETPDASLPSPNTPSEAMARDILELRAAGRAGEVTDEMMDQADDQYMSVNTPLPMDKASRLARASEQEYAGDYFHGSNLGFQQFGKSTRGTFLTDSPAVADSYVGKEGGTIYPALVRGGSDFPVVQGGGEFYTHIPLSGLPDELGYLKNDAQSNRMSTDEIVLRSGEQRLPGVIFEDVVDPGANIKQYLGETVEEADRRLAQSQLPSDVINVVDPSKIRSKFARFDPEFKGLRNLSAGVGGAAVLSSIGEDAEAGTVTETVSSIKEKYPLFSDIEVRDLRDQGVQDGRRLEFTEAYDDRYDKPLIEIFDPALQGDELEQAIIGEFLHEAPRRIPEYAKLREKLQKLKTPQQLQDDMNSYLYDVENYGENRPFEKWDEVSRKDAFIRGHAVGQWEPEYYTDEQKTLIDEMMGLIRSGANK